MMRIMNQNLMKHPVNPVGDTGKNRNEYDNCVIVIRVSKKTQTQMKWDKRESDKCE